MPGDTKEKTKKTFWFVRFPSMQQPEKWLNSKAVKGYSLSRVKGFRYEFTKEPGQNLTYRSDDLFRNVSDLLQYRILCGWKYICSDKNRHFFSAEKGNSFRTGDLYKKEILRQKKRLYLYYLLKSTLLAVLLLLGAGFTMYLTRPGAADVFYYIAALILPILAFSLVIRYLFALRKINLILKVLSPMANRSTNAFICAPSMDYAASFIEACKEHKLHKSPFYDVDTPEQLQKLLRRLERTGIAEQEGQIPYDTYWLVDNGEYIASGNIRTGLNSELRFFGGHIAYEIRPGKKNMGYEALILKLLLEKAALLKMDTIRVTCEANDLTAINAIEYNNGHLADLVQIKMDERFRPTRIYLFLTGNERGE